MKFLVLNGPNLNLLGLREPQIYGNKDYAALCHCIEDCAKTADVEVEILQSNHEGVLVDEIQRARLHCDGIIINPAAYTHTSVAILDALKAVALPAVEVHLSDPMQREAFRHLSYAGMACLHSIRGEGFAGYEQAILFLQKHLDRQ